MFDRDKEVVIVGATSKLGVFICKYPLGVMLIILFVGEMFAFMTGADTNHLLRGPLLLLSVCIPIILIVFIMSKKWCYRIEINKSNNTINFYRLFNRGVCSFPLVRIKIIIGAWCHICVEDAEFILHYVYIHDLVSYIPKDSMVEYKGRVGKLTEQEWNRNNKPLIPGSRL